MNLDGIWNTVRQWFEDHPTEMTIVGVALGLGLLAVVLVMVIRALRGKDLNAKASIGFGVVQAGVAYITITGVYEFFHLLLNMPPVEAGLLAGFIEACVWAAVGMIYAHGKSTVTTKTEDGSEEEKPSTGFGAAGPFFWVTIVGGGTLAILGSQSSPVAVGRIVVVVLGAYMWYLRLLQVTRRSTEASRWQWTPKRFLLAIGALKPTSDDVTDDVHEWQVRQIARAIRWSNSKQPWSWFGKRSLIKRAENTKEEVLAEGRRRWAAAYVLSTEVKPDAPVMASIIASVHRAQEPEKPEVQDVRQVRDTDAELADLERQIRERHTAELEALHGDLTARKHQLAELERQLAGARSTGDTEADLVRAHAQLEQLEQLRRQEQENTAAAARAATEQQRRAEQLEAQLAEVTAELEKARKNGPLDNHIEQLIDALADGKQLTGSLVADPYKVPPRTAQRWLTKAREAYAARQEEAEQQPEEKRTRSLTVVNGR